MKINSSPWDQYPRQSLHFSEAPDSGMLPKFKWHNQYISPKKENICEVIVEWMWRMMQYWDLKPGTGSTTKVQNGGAWSNQFELLLNLKQLSINTFNQDWRSLKVLRRRKNSERKGFYLEGGSCDIAKTLSFSVEEIGCSGSTHFFLPLTLPPGKAQKSICI